MQCNAIEQSSCGMRHCRRTIRSLSISREKKHIQTSVCTIKHTHYILFVERKRFHGSAMHFRSRFWDFGATAAAKKPFKYRINVADLQNWHSGQCSMHDLTQIIAFHFPFIHKNPFKLWRIVCTEIRLVCRCESFHGLGTRNDPFNTRNKHTHSVFLLLVLCG